MRPEQFRLVVSRVLIVGVSVSAVLISAGFVGALLVGWEGSLRGAGQGSEPLTDYERLAADLIALRPIGLAQAGIVALILTPVVRVGASVFGFLLEGDRLYAGITLIVLAILLVSLFGLH
jgi:uncharacterized membrane protein